MQRKKVKKVNCEYCGKELLRYNGSEKYFCDAICRKNYVANDFDEYKSLVLQAAIDMDKEPFTLTELKVFLKWQGVESAKEISRAHVWLKQQGYFEPSKEAGFTKIVYRVSKQGFRKAKELKNVR